MGNVVLQEGENGVCDAAGRGEWACGAGLRGEWGM